MHRPPVDPVNAVSSSELLAKVRSKRTLDEFVAAPSTLPLVAPTTGFHVYADITLNLNLAAAEDTAAADRYIRVLREYANIASVAAQISGASLLEVQGERLHFLIEEAVSQSLPSAEGWAQLLALAHTIVELAYERIEPLAKDDWRGCKVAADYGRAILLTSTCGGGSVVSLGPAANNPAKKLNWGGGVRAEHLAFPGRLGSTLPHGDVERGWRQINVRTPSQELRNRFNIDLTQSVRQRLADKPASHNIAFSVQRNVQQLFQALEKNSLAQPYQVQAFCFRADLDGFSKQVEGAFEEGPIAILELAYRFSAILDCPKKFAESINARVIELPWAGDCATVLLVPSEGESFNSARSYMPAQAACKWHEELSTYIGRSSRTPSLKWVVGVAAGDESEGSDGQMLVEELVADGRRFRVIAGWPARRSNDAYQSENTLAGYTVLTKIDLRHLAPAIAEKFHELNADFSYARRNDLGVGIMARSDEANVTNLVGSKSVLTLPKPKPYHGGNV